MIAYVKDFGMVWLFPNGDVDWIQKEKTDLFLSYYCSICAAQLESKYQWRLQ